MNLSFSSTKDNLKNNAKQKAPRLPAGRQVFSGGLS